MFMMVKYYVYLHNNTVLVYVCIYIQYGFVNSCNDYLSLHAYCRILSKHESQYIQHTQTLLDNLCTIAMYLCTYISIDMHARTDIYIYIYLSLTATM